MEVVVTIGAIRHAKLEQLLSQVTGERGRQSRLSIGRGTELHILAPPYRKQHVETLVP